MTAMMWPGGLELDMSNDYTAAAALRPETDRLLTSTQVAEHLQVPTRTLEAWRYTGTGPTFVRVGKYVRYRHTDVDAWVASQEAA